MNHRAKKKPQISPLRCAPVEMTNLLPGHDLVSIRRYGQSLKKFVISTGGIMEQWASQGDENALRPATAFHGNAPSSFVTPPAPARRGSVADLSRRAVEGSAAPRTFTGNVFRQGLA